jgi:AraC-like DNA-binding protein
MRSQLVRLALLALRAVGADLEAFRARFDLPGGAESDPEVIVPLSVMRALFDEAEKQTGDPLLGAHLATRFERGTFGILEFAARSAPTVRESLRRIVRYMALLNELVVVRFEEDAGAAVVSQRIPGEPLCLGRHANEFFVTIVVAQARALTGLEVVPTRVFLAHPAPAEVAPLAALWGTTRIDFGRGENGVVLPASLLDAPMASADPALLALLDRQAEQALSLQGSKSRLLGHIRRTVRDSLRGGPPTLDDVAASMKMSSRTLQRRLGEEGVTFQGVVESVREELARTLVADGSRPLGEIAFLLGYAELSPFLRAFKRWTGMTATAYRAR